MKNILKSGKYKVLAIAVIISIATFTILQYNNTTAEFSMESEIVKRGDVSNSITATGTLEATNTVIVGTQVSGVIEHLYVDFNSQVKEGQLIAELDKSTLLASLESAEASVDEAEADLEYQTSNLKRMKALLDKEMLAENEYDQYLYNYKRSMSDLKSSKADLSRAKQNLSYAMIYSPIDGVVLNRAVEEGQTVAASMSTPELFTITNDLAEMEVEADVDEADIGMIKVGQRVDFTVDAFPDDIFKGAISEVRLQPTVSSNVVTYTVVVSVKNIDYKLKPGMTASITSYVEEVVDILTVSAKALRFDPDPEVIQSYIRSTEDRPENPESNKREEKRLDKDSDIVWIVTEQGIQPTAVEIGISDGITTEIISGLKEGDKIIKSLSQISGSVEKMDKDSEGSPFMPSRPGKGKK